MRLEGVGRGPCSKGILALAFLLLPRVDLTEELGMLARSAPPFDG